MEKTLSEFVHGQNVIRYLRQLRTAPDVLSRGVLMSLLAEERASARVHGWSHLRG